MDGKGQWALVTGASGGMGSEFAACLARRGYNILLTARDPTRLRAAADGLTDYGVDLRIEPADLSLPHAAAELLRTVREQGIDIDVLVNNAGQGLHGRFVDQSPVALDRMLQLNVGSLTTLTRAVAADMAARGRGHVLLVASLTAYMPCPSYAAYAASKAYVRLLGEAIHAELSPRGVAVTVLSPGLMDTGFLRASGQQPSASMKRAMTSPRAAAEAGLEALFVGRQAVVAGATNRIVAAATRLIPRAMLTRIAAGALNG